MFDIAMRYAFERGIMVAKGGAGAGASERAGGRATCMSMSEIEDLSSISPHIDSGLMNPVTNLEKVVRYLTSIENGDFAYIADLFSPDAVLEQLPNRIYPNGIKSGVSGMAEAFEKGRKLLSNQSYELKSCVADGDRLSVEVLWTGTLAVAFGSLAAGSQMRAHSAMFFQFKDGKIVSQRNFDCFEPW